jgi:hypothetical protein
MYIKASNIPSEAQENIINVLLGLTQATRSKKFHREKVRVIPNNILAARSPLFLYKTKKPSVRAIIIVGI